MSLRWFLFVFLVVACSQSHAALVAVDLGADNYKMMYLQGSNIDIILSDQSERKTFNGFAFTNDGARLFSGQAKNLITKRPQSVVTAPHLLLAQKPSNTTLNQEFMYFPLKNDNERDDQTFLIALDVLPFTPEEALASVLENGIAQAETYTERPSLKEVSILAPYYLTHHERVALINSAKIAGLNVLSLVSHGVAAAVSYSLSRDLEKDLQESNNAPIHVMFLDVGASATTATLIEYKLVNDTKKKHIQHLNIQTLATGFDRDLGGRNFDLCIERLLWKEIDQAFKKPVPREARYVARLRKESQRIKEILSANQETVVSIESFYDDRDFLGKLNRLQFEQECQAEGNRVLQPILDAFTQANLTSDQVTAIELLGGGSRVPLIHDLLRSTLNRKELDRHLNGDEAAVYGAAFLGAFKSSTVRIKNQIKVRDILPYPIRVDFSHVGLQNPSSSSSSSSSPAATAVEGETTGDSSSDSDSPALPSAEDLNILLFKSGSRFDSKKTISFRYDQNFSFELTYDASPALPVGTPTVLTRFAVSGFPDPKKLNFTGTPKISLIFQLNHNGIVEISKAEAEVVVTSLVKSKISNSKPSTPSADQDQSDEAVEAVEAAHPTTEEDVEPTPVVVEEEALYEYIPTRKTEKITLKVKSLLTPLDLSVEQIEKSKKKLKTLLDIDTERKQLEQDKNDLESFIYATRERLSDDDWLNYSIEEEQQTLAAALEVEEEWLYNEGSEATSIVLRKHLASLRKLTDPIDLRRSEITQRPIAIEHLRSSVLFLRGYLINVSRDYNVTEAEVLDVMESINITEKWLNETEAAQEQLAINSDPILTSSQIYDRIEVLQKLVKKLTKSPKRKPPPKSSSSSKGKSSSSSKEPQPPKEEAEQPPKEEPEVERKSQQKAAEEIDFEFEIPSSSSSEIPEEEQQQEKELAEEAANVV